MKTFLKNFSFGIISLILIAFLFASGYLVGAKTSYDNYAPTRLTGTLNASTSADFSSFWQVWNLIDEKFVSTKATSTATDEERVWGSIKGMVSSLGDPYTVFLTPKENEQFETNISGNFQGVGMEVGMKDEILTVVAPLKNTPAEKAGIKAGDRIVKIDDVSTQNLTVDEAVQMIRGEVGTKVNLLIDRDGVADLLEITVTRAVINIPTLSTETIDGVFVIHLYNFSAKASTDFRAALREFVLSKKNKLIIDLRGNPGGYLDASVDIASWFLPSGTTIVREDFGNGEEKVIRSKGYNIFNEKLKIAILIDGGSASASEILAGALKENGVAILVGENTFGKGSVQELVPITPETSLKVTIARWLTPDGKSISDGGLSPDYEVVSDEKDAKLSELQMKKAIELLKNN